ncbi:MAG: Nif3-like dinuclear metal center hexameric protein [Gammaproteobacteria bacterium]
MVALRELVDYTDALLNAPAFQDYCPNGLQVEGGEQVRSLVAGVTASQALVDAAVQAGADALLVHHGYFWKGEHPAVTGMKRRRLKALLDHGISLLAYHLPLDAHPVYGNNAQLAARLGLAFEGRFGTDERQQIAMKGVLSQPMDGATLARHIGAVLRREPLHIAGGAETIRSIGWCTGAAQGYIERAAALGLDAYLSGEVSEPTVHAARELGIHYFAAGHHATERYGAEALGGHLAAHFGLAFRFIDIDNPV